jgi:hypothetical protein
MPNLLIHQTYFIRRMGETHASHELTHEGQLRDMSGRTPAQ